MVCRIDLSYGRLMRASRGLGVAALLVVAGCASSAPSDEDDQVVEAPATVGAPIESPPSDSPTTSTTSSLSTTSTTTTTSPSTANTTTTPATTDSEAVTAASSDLAVLDVADPDPGRVPYERDRYDGDGWLDADGDCRSTRHELLAAYSLDEPTIVADGCRVDAGRWVDPFDGAEYTLETQVSIDHLVPLAEAHRSGAWKWDDDTKQRFANDETPGHLLVVGRDSNQAKADKRPDEWLPADPAAHCQYAVDWITTKTRYGLSVTAPEEAALDTALDSCKTSTTNLRPAVDAPSPVVVVTTPTTTTSTTIAPSVGLGVVALLSCNKRSETVSIGNTGGESISLAGFVLHDDGAKHSTSLDSFGSLAPAQELRILTGPDAVSGDGQVVWKNQNVWNNDGDTAHLIGFGIEQVMEC